MSIYSLINKIQEKKVEFKIICTFDTCFKKSFHWVLLKTCAAQKAQAKANPMKKPQKKK